MTDFPVGCRNRHKTLCLIWHHLICGTTVLYLYIYIPLCFYFIDNPDHTRTQTIQFTFHYASTLSGAAALICVYNSIYIPLCFYFIKFYDIVLVQDWYIYIPLCFYFIGGHGREDLPGVSFTFHYASTLSKTPLRVPVLKSSFTFHYASTLSKRLGKDCVALIIHLHSTMLLLYRQPPPLTCT